MSSIASEIAVVVIGRNEGDRLVRCLQSVLHPDRLVVYVDSASTDGSAGRAKQLGARVVQIDPDLPFTAARARNTGLKTALETAPGLQFVQFVDGDCEVDGNWMSLAMRFLEQHPDVAAVCGRRRERFPEASIYNSLCDIEWDSPVGQARSCGGDVLMRVRALRDAGGYRDSMIAGEEPELCVRLRATGWRIWRLDAEMTLHDAAMTRLSQWWRRNRRAGHAYGEGAHLHGEPPERHNVSAVRSAMFWGLGVPTLALVSGLATGSMAPLLMLIAYPAQVIRLALRGRQAGWLRWQYALFLTIGKFPECLGVLTFQFNRVSGRHTGLIEYK